MHSPDKPIETSAPTAAGVCASVRQWLRDPLYWTATRQGILITVITSGYNRWRLPSASSSPNIELARLPPRSSPEACLLIRPSPKYIHFYQIFSLNEPSALGAIWSVSTIKRAKLHPDLVASLPGRQTGFSWLTFYVSFLLQLNNGLKSRK